MGRMILLQYRDSIMLDATQFSSHKIVFKKWSINMVSPYLDNYELER